MPSRAYIHTQFMLLHDLLAKYIERRFSDDNADHCWCTLQTAAHQ